jgi:hypothetical protein
VLARLGPTGRRVVAPRAARRTVIAAALGLALAGCAGPRPAARGPDPTEARWSGPPPGPPQVRQAAAWLHDELVRRFPPWPEGVARSTDFPELPLVEVRPVRDRAGWGLDADLLLRTLEASLQGEKQLRLLEDERAVPEFLRDGAAAAPASVGAPLVLESWIPADGRLHLELRTDGGEPLVRVQSGRASEE